ncbi:putative oxidoreductase protein [Pseudorhizobium banfieldiae]|uniref:Putative oxidoreductase protein n=1 Tax=Pseudorhizobium banfieldiae TaxID=1125847 RepID=L0NFH4_9HYPH|nr:Gfo/Idh/MocA family oxidoreductase [Pseudorhizobium banfieldiae]CAD6609488.1 gfo/Idh/MocA family oxidoreductase [arsenite-oxidising bacterium NT-25]CCF19566.1 putative oxidoreductase protein [Pseudorhizobium banfieldiae]
MNEVLRSSTMPAGSRPARLGFLGVGWIGRHRMEAILSSGAGEAVVIADASPEMVEEARRIAPAAKVVDGFDELLRHELDGIVIATPSAQHAAQSIQALEAGFAVFCQKPLSRNAREVEAVVDAARKADRLLGVDLSYRHTQGMEHIHTLLQNGELGSVYAVDLVFHNAYGPDKPWFYDKQLSGGGCVMDLGIHLADLALWALDFPQVEKVSSQLFHQGRRISGQAAEVEDFATATIELSMGTVLRLTCSWRLQAGTDAIIGASFYGTGGGAEMRNVSGSFYDFVAERFQGTSRAPLSEPPEAWGGRAAVDWARRLQSGGRFDPACSEYTAAAAVIDQIYSAA